MQKTSEGDLIDRLVLTASVLSSMGSHIAMIDISDLVVLLTMAHRTEAAETKLDRNSPPIHALYWMAERAQLTPETAAVREWLRRLEDDQESPRA